MIELNVKSFFELLKKEVKNSFYVGCSICMGGRSLDHISPEKDLLTKEFIGRVLSQSVMVRRMIEIEIPI